MDEIGFFDSFMPHGMCYLWYPNILLLHVVSDAFIAIAYFCIPVALYYFFRHRTDFPFRNVILMFSIFIFTCGLSHVMGIWTVWNGAYGLQGLVKGATALASAATAIMLIPLMPQLMALRSPRELEVANAALITEVDRRVRSETRAQRFVEAAPDAVVIVDSGQIIQVVNAQAESMFDVSRDKLVGQRLDVIVPGHGEAALLAKVKAFSENPSQEAHMPEREFLGLRSDDTRFPIEVSVSGVGTPEQELFSLAIRDVTKRNELARQTHALEQQIAHVDRLDTMGQMAAGLAHEINQPLLSLAQSADSALAWNAAKGEVDPELTDMLKDIEAQAHRAGDIIRALRQFIGNDDTSRATFKLDDLLAQTLRLIDNDAKQHGIKIRNEVAKSTVVFGARVQVAQVLVNLVRNSMEAMVDANTKDPEIVVAADVTLDEVTVSVADNGPGLSDGEKLFVPFQSDKADGMGMGLSICRSIVESHGGVFSIETDQDVGVRFTFTLPRTGNQR